MNKINLKERRDLLCRQIGRSGVAILFAAQEQERNKKNFYPYRQDSDFYYLTGFKEPEAIAVFIPERDEGEFILFNRENDPFKESWHGKMAGQEGACKDYSADQSFPINLADSLIPKMLIGRRKIYFNINEENMAKIAVWYNQLIGKATGVQEPGELINIGIITHEMRMIKDLEEISLMRRSSAIIAQAQCKAMQVCRPNMHEYELEAEILYECVKNGARFQAFESIVAGGANGCVLHYATNNEILKDGDLVLVDAGAEYDYYASDMTRTFPVNGRFTQEQRIIYQMVLDIQTMVLAQIKSGVRWIELQQLAERVATEKLLAVGLLHGNLEELIEVNAFLPFFRHKIGHWIGLDIHDVGWYKKRHLTSDACEEWRTLEPNMIMTIEPGMYVSGGEAASGIPSKWQNIAVRIEDTILVKENGYELLTGSAPKTVEEIENFMQNNVK